MKKITFFTLTLFIITACTPKTTEVVGKVESTEFPSSDVAAGSALYTENCGKCHKLKIVTDFTQAQWKEIVPKMAEKAKLDASQENKIMQYTLWKTSN